MFLINSNMNPKVRCLNDLTIYLHEINKKFRISEFVQEYKGVVGTKSAKALNEFERDNLINPFQKIMNLSSKVSEDQLAKMIQIGDSLSSKYDYSGYLDACQAIREEFLEERKNYFSCKVTSNEKKDIITNIFELSGTGDLILADFLDHTLVNIYPLHLDVVYEDLSGKKIKAKIRSKDIKITKDHVDAPLIDRYHGINAYDTFLLRSFYDFPKKKWIYIPVRLIISVTCEEDIKEILDMDID